MAGAKAAATFAKYGLNLAVSNLPQMLSAFIQNQAIKKSALIEALKQIGPNANDFYKAIKGLYEISDTEAITRYAIEQHQKVIDAYCERLSDKTISEYERNKIYDNMGRVLEDIRLETSMERQSKNRRFLAGIGATTLGAVGIGGIALTAIGNLTGGNRGGFRLPNRIKIPKLPFKK